MGFKFRDLARKTKRATLDLGDGDVLTFDFRHQLLTPALIADLTALDALDGGDAVQRTKAEAAAVGATMTRVSAHLTAIVAWWDLLDDDGVTMFPLDAARIAADLPLLFQTQLLMTILAEMHTGEAPAPEQTTTTAAAVVAATAA